jgi:hypothetical protein
MSHCLSDSSTKPCVAFHHLKFKLLWKYKINFLFPNKFSMKHRKLHVELRGENAMLKILLAFTELQWNTDFRFFNLSFPAFCVIPVTAPYNIAHSVSQFSVSWSKVQLWANYLVHEQPLWAASNVHSGSLGHALLKTFTSDFSSG